MVERKWQFKTKFRAKAFGWRGSRLAISRLKEAVSEIKAVAKSDPVAAGDGAVSLMERIWPAFQDIDTSSGALGGRANVGRIDSDPHRRYGRSFDKKQVAQAIV